MSTLAGREYGGSTQLLRAHCLPVMWQLVADCCSESHHYHNQLMEVMRNHVVGLTVLHFVIRPTSKPEVRIADFCRQTPGSAAIHCQRDSTSGTIPMGQSRPKIMLSLTTPWLHTYLPVKHLRVPRMSHRVPEGNASSTRMGAPASFESAHCTVRQAEWHMTYKSTGETFIGVGHAKDLPRHVRLRERESISSLATNTGASPQTRRAKTACPRPSNPVAFESTHDAAMRSWAASQDCDWSEVTHPLEVWK
ncbi:hypothetical protein EDB87DRAFT_374154 [Lactarius vividus]|nr:hypothetical protein EDB87DRAFT_374154 [Lactarius vividus]